ncbi:cell division protein FtsN [Wenyingzhuangia heitensis]|uniref:Cell division protein FtsN n=1 Tax=Wenyingzhuangia heitensis TaxID=1487859 RepID=A0ABX0U9K1_9FLAO|nr:hypothetical protein [Wenyingzhuangia heitensis]NIJ44156.1 cell division protein FtsN [Wenyingzhuangia heitensis]
MRSFLLAITVFVMSCSSKKEETPVAKVNVAVSKKETVKEQFIDTVFYAVQIGAYKDFNVEFSSDIIKISENGLNHYVLGSLKTKSEADRFLEILIDLGVKDAFVVKLSNHKIVEKFYEL